MDIFLAWLFGERKEWKRFSQKSPMAGFDYEGTI